LEHPAHLQSLHSDYSLASEHLVADADMLSPLAKQYSGAKLKPSQKLLPDLFDKSNYVTNY